MFEQYEIGKCYLVAGDVVRVIAYSSECGGFEPNGPNRCRAKECNGSFIYMLHGVEHRQCGHCADRNRYPHVPELTNVRW